MKIISVNNTADNYGASRCLYRIARRLLQDGHELHVVTPKKGPLTDLLAAEGATIHLHPGLCIIDRAQMKTLKGRLHLLWSFPSSTLWLLALFLRLKADVVHTNTVVLPTPGLAARLVGVRHIWHVRELLAEFKGLWRPYQRYLVKCSNAIIAISTCVREQFEPSLQGTVHTIYDGLDEADDVLDGNCYNAVRSRFPQNATVVGVVGRIKFHRKGQEVLVEAAALLRDVCPEVHYAIVGSAAPGNESQVTALRDLIEERGMSDRISILGELSPPSSIFSALDIAVVPSVQPEPFGCVVIEAMQVGTPVIGSRCGGIPDQIVEKESGLLFTPGSASELSACIHSLVADANLRSELGRNAKQRVQTHFHLDTTYLHTRDLLRGDPK